MVHNLTGLGTVMKRFSLSQQKRIDWASVVTGSDDAWKEFAPDAPVLPVSAAPPSEPPESPPGDPIRRWPAKPSGMAPTVWAGVAIVLNRLFRTTGGVYVGEYELGMELYRSETGNPQGVARLRMVEEIVVYLDDQGMTEYFEHGRGWQLTDYGRAMVETAGAVR